MLRPGASGSNTGKHSGLSWVPISSDLCYIIKGSEIISWIFVYLEGSLYVGLTFLTLTLESYSRPRGGGGKQSY